MTIALSYLIRVIGFDVSDMVSGQLVDGFFDFHQAVVLPHGQGGEISVRSSSVPVTLNK